MRMPECHRMAETPLSQASRAFRPHWPARNGGLLSRIMPNAPIVSQGRRRNSGLNADPLTGPRPTGRRHADPAAYHGRGIKRGLSGSIRHMGPSRPDSGGRDFPAATQPRKPAWSKDAHSARFGLSAPQRNCLAGTDPLAVRPALTAAGPFRPICIERMRFSEARRDGWRDPWRAGARSPLIPG